MTTKQLLDLVLNHFVMIGSTDATNATWRERALERLQEVVEEVWDESDWDFKAGTTTLNLLANGATVDAPADLATIGENGGLFISGQQTKLRFLHPGLLLSEYQHTSGTGRPSAYAIISQNSTTQAPVIQFDTAVDQNYTIRLNYDTTPPVLIDAPDAPNLALAVGAGLGTGTYRYGYSFVAGTLEGEVGAYQTITTSGSSFNVTVTFGTGASSFVTARKLYRTVVGGTDLKLLTTVSDNTTTTYLDAIADGSLGAAAVTISSLTRIPQEYHRSVLQNGLKAKMAPDFGDPKALEWEAKYRAALARMKSRRVAGLEDDERILEGGVSSLGMW